jgi:hypothetical protein
MEDYKLRELRASHTLGRSSESPNFRNCEAFAMELKKTEGRKKNELEIHTTPSAYAKSDISVSSSAHSYRHRVVSE